MPIANDTEDDVLYTAGDPGDAVSLAKGCYRNDISLHQGVVIRFWKGAKEVASTGPLDQAETLVILKRDWQTYEVDLFAQQT